MDNSIDCNIINNLFNYLNIDTRKLLKINGFSISAGRYANILKNYYYEYNNDDYNIIFINCNDVFTCMDKYIYNELIKDKKLTLTYHKATGYINTKITKYNVNDYLRKFMNDNKETTAYLHKIILKYYVDNEDPTLSVDHINMNKLDNRIENLRWASQSLQNSNRVIYNKNKNPLQAAILREIQKYESNLLILPTYVHVKNKGRCKKIEDCDEDNILDEISWSFCIDGHPLRKLANDHPLKDKVSSQEWTGSESKKLTTYEKYLEVKQKLEEINSGIPYKLKKLPEYVYISTPKDRKPGMVFEYRDQNTNKRISKKITIKADISNVIDEDEAYGEYYDNNFKNILLEFIDEKKKSKELSEDFELIYKYK